MTKENEMRPKSLSNTRGARPDQHIPPISGFLFGIILLAATGGAILMDGRYPDILTGSYVVALTLLGLYIFFGLKVAAQWEKAVILRFGKFHALRGPGLFWIVPIMDTTPSWIDHRVMVT